LCKTTEKSIVSLEEIVIIKQCYMHLNIEVKIIGIFDCFLEFENFLTSIDVENSCIIKISPNAASSSITLDQPYD